MSSTHTHSPKQVINEASTKAAIIEAAKEFISLQDEDLSSKAKLIQALQEEKQALTYVLIATSSFGFLFWYFYPVSQRQGFYWDDGFNVN